MSRGPSVRAALLLAGVAGVVITLQARVNGELAESTGSAVVAALASFVVGTVAVAAAVAASRPARQAVRRRPGRTRWYWWVGGLGGAAVVSVAAYAVGRTGVALLTVLLVAGSTTGALLVDQVGLGPAGRQRVTRPRLLGATLAVGAVALSGLGSLRTAGLLVLVLVVLAGAGASAQQAVNGQLARVMGAPQAAALVSFAVGTVALGILTAVLVGTGRLPGVSLTTAPWWQWTGGLAGALYIVLSATVVRRLGVLRLALATVAGQVVGALVLDLVAPPEGQGLRGTTVLASLLTVAAVAVAGRGAQPAPAVAAAPPRVAA